VTEYQAEVVVDEKGKRFVASFPSGVSQQTQYGPGVKAQVVFDSQSQLIPNMRAAEDMAENVGYSISVGTIHNAIEDAFNRLEPFEAKAKEMLKASKILHLDETGININGKNYWLHGCTSDKWTLLMPHKKRGSDAMDEMGILPHFKNIMVHDHWKPYFKYDTKHCLCNAHHLRELERAFEQDGCKWAEEMKKMLLDANNKKIELERVMPIELQDDLRQRYRDILKAGEIETPPPPPPPAGKKGRPKRTKARNLLERLRDFETETLRFMTAPEIPFTNNQGERDLRMTKVQLKISGCHRSEKGAMYSARIRSFLSTCKKHDVKVVGALKDLFLGKLPDFVS
jgi:transposase